MASADPSSPSAKVGVPAQPAQFVDVAGRRLEVTDLPGRGDLAPLVLLHEGLGCLSMWRSVPAWFAAATGRRTIAYSRAGYGRSDPVPLPRPVDYMHSEALEVLPELLDSLAVTAPVLIGHSDGASIALIHTGAAVRPVTGVVALAPHVFVEDRTIDSIKAARGAYMETDLRQRLGRYHADPDIAFWGWNDVWLSPAFRQWDISSYVERITVPLLILQGSADEYGTLRQVDAVVSRAGGPVAARMFDGCGHAPHIQRPDETMAAVLEWLGGLDGVDR